MMEWRPRRMIGRIEHFSSPLWQSPATADPVRSSGTPVITAPEAISRKPMRARRKIARSFMMILKCLRNLNAIKKVV